MAPLWPTAGNAYRALRDRLTLPPVPKQPEKDKLLDLESLLVSSPRDSQYSFDSQKPLTCGATPQRIPVEVRAKNDAMAITYWYYWDYDIIRGDHEDWEPVSLVYKEGKLVLAYSRVHDALVEHTQFWSEPIVLYFEGRSHTPAVNSTKRRIVRGSSVAKEEWLRICYRNAKRLGWKLNSPQTPLMTTGAPKLDQIYWRTWGKHSIFLEL